MFKPRILIVALVFLLLASCTACGPSTAEKQAHGAIKDAGETVVYTALSLVNEAELDITEDDLENFGSALNLLDSSKAAFYSKDYMEAKNLAEQAAQQVLQLKDHLGIEELHLEDVYVQPPEGEVAKYKGIWTHTIDALRSALLNVQRLKAMGVNTITITPNLRQTGDGEVYTVGKDMWIFYILAFHRAGLKVLLVPDPHHPNGAGHRGRYHFGRELLERHTPVVLEWAELSEKYGVEIFAPVNEVTSVVYAYFSGRGDEEGVEEYASSWLQKIRPEIRKRYSGKLAIRTHHDLDLRGYNYVMAPLPPPTPAEMHTYYKRQIDDSANSAIVRKERDGCDGTFILDWGAYLGGSWYEPIPDFQIGDEAVQEETFKLIFDQLWDKVDGFFPCTTIGWEFLGRPAEQVVKAWYAKEGVLEPHCLDALWKTPGLLKLVEKTLSPGERPFYHWTRTNNVQIDEEHPGPFGRTNMEDCDYLAFWSESICYYLPFLRGTIVDIDRWLVKQGREPYGSDLFVLDHYNMN